MNLKNIPGFSTHEKIVVIESDDWGSIRMPNKRVYEELLRQNVKVDSNNFTRLDTVASAVDIENLFDVLTSVSDVRDQYAKLTPFTCMTNPDFDHLKMSNFGSYKYEVFTETIEKYHGSSVFQLWKKGIDLNIFVPEYHGREHYNVFLLMDLLKDGNVDLMNAIQNDVVHIPIVSERLKYIKSIYPTYYYSDSNQLKVLLENLKEGVKIFESVFGRSPNCFGPPNGVFSFELEQAFKDTGLKGLVVNRNRIEPTGKGDLSSSNFLFKSGVSNLYGQRYYRRNSKFEPVQSSYSLERTLSEVQAAFFWNKPAVISSHRINYVGGLDNKHKYYALDQLKQLLKSITKKWPDVLFLTSGEFINYMHLESNKS
ncbi:MAG: hypothetical protein ACJASM_002295 [Salibacteraceae bacterium]|jgi:hypothetical protein